MTSAERPIAILRPDGVVAGRRAIAIEVPVAIEVDGLGYAVMMMTPADLEAFATGFMLTERLADTAADVIAVEPFEAEAGWIVRVALSDRCRSRIHDRVRHRTSDTSCGLCGISGLEQLRKPVPSTPPRPDTPVEALFAALGGLRAHQPLNAPQLIRLPRGVAAAAAVVLLPPLQSSPSSELSAVAAGDRRAPPAFESRGVER